MGLGQRDKEKEDEEKKGLGSPVQPHTRDSFLVPRLAIGPPSILLAPGHASITRGRGIHSNLKSTKDTRTDIERPFNPHASHPSERKVRSQYEPRPPFLRIERSTPGCSSPVPRVSSLLSHVPPNRHHESLLSPFGPVLQLQSRVPCPINGEPKTPCPVVELFFPVLLSHC